MHIVPRIIYCIISYIPRSECMALTYFSGGGCAIFLVGKKSFPICARNSKCARRWRNPTCAERAKLRHLPHFYFKSPLPGLYLSVIKAFKNKGCVCSTKVLWERIFSLLKRWHNHLQKSRSEPSTLNVEYSFYGQKPCLMRR